MESKVAENLPPTTTAEEDTVTAGQRRVNIIWEITQATIAVGITAAIVYATMVGVSSPELGNAFFLIIGFYFSRTNHQAIGGIGRKPSSEYKGR